MATEHKSKVSSIETRTRQGTGKKDTRQLRKDNLQSAFGQDQGRSKGREESGKGKRYSIAKDVLQSGRHSVRRLDLAFSP